MKAPNKIYLLKVELEERWPGITEASELEPKKEECYIRKDALLEWLIECKDNPVITELQQGNIQELIDKIESL